MPGIIIVNDDLYCRVSDWSGYRPPRLTPAPYERKARPEGNAIKKSKLPTALLGTVLKETNTYDSYGLLQEFKTENITGTPVELMKLTYSFDAVRGNLSSRSNNAFGTAWNETFTYDSQDRLTGFTDNNGTYTQDYDNRGRITANSRVGNYTYTGSSYQQAGMNTLTAFALYHYQNLPLQQVSYNAFKQPVSIHEQDKERIDFQYNGGLGRAHMYYGSDATDKMARPYYRHYSGDGSMEITEDNPDGKTTFVFYLGGDAYSAPAIWKHEQTSSATTAALYYLHRDYQGSILLITDATGTVQEKRQFDAWGNIVKLTDGSNTALTAFVILDRGYTGHEHLLGVGLINMNGRLYDPILHRFFSPDNFVQDPTNTQNFNRYGYVLNNPLRYTDESGEFIMAPIAEIIERAVIGATIGVVMNGLDNRMSGQAFFHGWGKAAIIGAVGGVISGGIGDNAGTILNAYDREGFQMAAHGLLGGGMTAASGGNFWQGFAAGAASSFAASEFGSMFTGNGFGQIAGMYITGTISGGVSETVAGGSFWDGARDGAISAGLNHAMHLIADPRPKPPDPRLVDVFGNAKTAEEALDRIMSMKSGTEMSGDQFAALNPNLSIASKFVSEITRTDNGFKLSLSFAGKITMSVLPITIKNGSEFTVTSFTNGTNRIYQLVSPGNKIYFDNHLINFNIYLDNNRYSIYRNFSKYMNVWK